MATKPVKDVTSVAKRRPIDDIVVSEIQVPDVISTRELADAESFDAAVAIIRNEFGGSLVTADEELGDGFEVIGKEDKGKLVGLPMVFAEWTFRKGDMGPYVSIKAIARNEDGSPRRLIINDGSSGIMDQLAEYQNRTGRVGGLIVKRGLRESRYQFVNDAGHDQWASTFYLDTSA